MMCTKKFNIKFQRVKLKMQTDCLLLMKRKKFGYAS